MWVAHEHPERSLAWGAWVCDCAGCADVLRAALNAQPDLQLVLKSSMDRKLVSIREAILALDNERGLDGPLKEPGDWLREVFVADQPGRHNHRRCARRSYDGT